jgi:hypothetical protein
MPTSNRRKKSRGCKYGSRKNGSCKKKPRSTSRRRKKSGRTKYKVSGSRKKVSKSQMKCNKPRKSWRSGKKRVVKACSKGREKIIHYGASGYRHNYSPKAKRSFRARHKCSSATDKLTARYWACKDLWPN